MDEDQTTATAEQLVGVRLYPAQQAKINSFMRMFGVNRSEAIRMLIDAAEAETVLETIRYRVKAEA